jgi:hypothetical protein
MQLVTATDSRANVHTFNALFAIAASCGRPDIAFFYYIHEMKISKIKEDLFTFRTLFYASRNCGGKKEMYEAGRHFFTYVTLLRTFDDMIKAGVQPSDEILRMLLRVCTDGGHILKATELFGLLGEAQNHADIMGVLGAAHRGLRSHLAELSRDNLAGPVEWDAKQEHLAENMKHYFSALIDAAESFIYKVKNDESQSAVILIRRVYFPAVYHMCSLLEMVGKAEEAVQLYEEKVASCFGHFGKGTEMFWLTRRSGHLVTRYGKLGLGFPGEVEYWTYDSFMLDHREEFLMEQPFEHFHHLIQPVVKTAGELFESINGSKSDFPADVSLYNNMIERFAFYNEIDLGAHQVPPQMLQRSALEMLAQMKMVGIEPNEETYCRLLEVTEEDWDTSFALFQRAVMDGFFPLAVANPTRRWIDVSGLPFVVAFTASYKAVLEFSYQFDETYDDQRREYLSKNSDVLPSRVGETNDEGITHPDLLPTPGGPYMAKAFPSADGLAIYTGNSPSRYNCISSSSSLQHSLLKKLRVSLPADTLVEEADPEAILMSAEKAKAWVVARNETKNSPLSSFANIKH